MTGRPLSTKAWRREGRPSPGFLGEPPPPSPKLPLYSEVVKDQRAVPCRHGRRWSQEQTLVRPMQCFKRRREVEGAAVGVATAGWGWAVSHLCALLPSVCIPSPCERCPLLSARHSTPGQCPHWFPRGSRKS